MTEFTPRDTFDKIALLYDKARPSYPDALFDDILAYSNLQNTSRILEVGCGTGQATLPLARRGFTIDCIELGPQLAALASSKLKDFPQVSVTCANFETISLPSSSYDLLLSATAFHWIDPNIRFRKAHELLKPGGAIALFWLRPAQTAVTSRYIHALQQVYERVVPELAERFQMPPHPDAVATEYEQIIPASGYFGELSIRKHYLATEYSATAYTDLLDTFSDHRTLQPELARQLYSEIENLIETNFAGKILRETVALLYLARRL